MYMYISAPATALRPKKGCAATDTRARVHRDISMYYLYLCDAINYTFQLNRPPNQHTPSQTPWISPSPNTPSYIRLTGSQVTLLAPRVSSLLASVARCRAPMMLCMCPCVYVCV